MNIILVSKEYPPSVHSFGIGTFVSEYSKSLASAGHKVFVICSADDSLKSSDEIIHGIEVIRINNGFKTRKNIFNKIFFQIFLDVRYSFEVAKCIKEVISKNNIHIVEFPGFRGESFCWRLLYREKTPLVCRFHGFTGWVDKNWKDYIIPARIFRKYVESQELSTANLLISVSQQFLPALSNRVDRDKITVVPNSIDVQDWSCLKDISISDNDVNCNDIFFVGSLSINKGVDLLIEIVDELKNNSWWKGRLFLAGRKSAMYESLIKKLYDDDIPEWLIYLGYLNRNELAHYYRNAGVCCFPSRIEPFGFVCLEALACGGLIVATKKTGFEEILKDLKSSVLVDINCKASLKKAVLDVLTISLEERDELRKCSIQHVQKYFDHSMVLAQNVDVYESLIQ